MITALPRGSYMGYLFSRCSGKPAGVYLAVMYVYLLYIYLEVCISFTYFIRRALISRKYYLEIVSAVEKKKKKKRERERVKEKIIMIVFNVALVVACGRAHVYAWLVLKKDFALWYEKPLLPRNSGRFRDKRSVTKISPDRSKET